MSKNAIVLLSGGLDSTTALAIALDEGYQALALTVDYGQRHACELEAAARVAGKFRVEHQVVRVDLTSVGGSALTANIPVPKDQELGVEAIPVTYVPARNTIMLSLALAYAEVRNSSDIFVGVNAVDYSGYPDCRPKFIAAFEVLANLATKRAVEGAQVHIRAPLISLSKVEIIREGLQLGVDYGMTHSCYDPSPTGRACGRCDSCMIRGRAFAELGLEDPALATA